MVVVDVTDSVVTSVSLLFSSGSSVFSPLVTVVEIDVEAVNAVK